MKIQPINNNFTNESSKEMPDPYNSQFSKTDTSAFGGIKNGSLDFGDLKSGGSAQSPGFQIESEKAK